NRRIGDIHASEAGIERHRRKRVLILRCNCQGAAGNSYRRNHVSNCHFSSPPHAIPAAVLRGCESLVRYSYPYATLDGCTSPLDGFDTSQERLAMARWAEVHHRKSSAFRHKRSLNPRDSIDLHILLIWKGIRGFHARFISLSGPYSDGAPAARLRIPLSPFP